MPVITDANLQKIASLAANLALKDDCDFLAEDDSDLDPLLGSETENYIVTNTTKSMVVDYQIPSQEYMIANQVVGKMLKKISTPLGTVILKDNLLRVKGVVYKVVEPLGISSYSVFSEAIVVISSLEES